MVFGEYKEPREITITERAKEIDRLSLATSEAQESIEQWFKTREQRGKLSPVHDWSHVFAVGQHAEILAEEMARVKGFRPEEVSYIGLLAKACGYFHDIARRATEKEPHGIKGAKLIERLKKMGVKAVEKFSPQEIEDICQTTKIHEVAIGDIDKETKDLPEHLKIIVKSLVFADKLFEASGYRVLERRSFFVGNERLKKGDLKYLQEKYGEDSPLWAVAMESCMRLRAINALEDYPLSIQPLVKPLHAIQEQFYYATLKALGIDEEKLFSEMEKVNFPRFEKFKEKIEKNIKKSNSREQIQALSDDDASSARELILHFHHAFSPSQAIETFRPKGQRAAEWLEGIKSFREGGREYFEKMRETIKGKLE